VLPIPLRECVAHCRRRNDDPELFQVTDDPLAAPSRILPCETDDKFPNVTSN